MAVVADSSKKGVNRAVIWIGSSVIALIVGAHLYFFIFLYGVPPIVTIPNSWRCDPEAFGAPRNKVLANVYNSKRLPLVSRCLTVSGTVTKVTHDSDGDWHVWLDVDSKYRPLLNNRNRRGLVVEVVPADQPDCKKGDPITESRRDLGVCTGRHIREPAIGAHVAVSGPYVLDTHHGWMEIHPVWSIR